MKWFRKKKKEPVVDLGSKDEALLPVVDVVSSGLSRLEQQIQQVMMQNKYVMDLNNKVLEQNTSMLRTISSVDSKDAEEPLAIKQGSFAVKVGDTAWKVSGYSSVAPDADFDYFPELKFEPKRVGGATYDFYHHKVISCIIPCYNESARELKRSIRSLFRQRMPTGWRVEAVIVMDGADCMEPTLIEHLYTMFGVRFNSNDPETDPFLMLPLAQTIIVEPVDEDAAHSRTPVMECTIGGFSLVVKRTNQRKANSQMWWLGPHSSGIGCKYSLATDCGTVFSRTATVRLIRRMEAEPDLHAVTGFQRIMTSEMQGDGSWEIIHNPAAYCLRMLQRFEFEVSTHIRSSSNYAG
jgi:cellulose synthase/poly-beta-1,6-N-acetylglucosamine synthase-like glycosyltransferase